MGKFVDQLRKRGAYLYGSRALGVANVASDWDWALLYTTDNEKFLFSCGFNTDSSYGSSRRRIGRIGSAMNRKALTDLPGFSSEKMQSHRKGNTNVVLFTPRAFAANKYATEMSATHKGCPELLTKEGRIELYQRYGQEYLKLYPIVASPNWPLF